jgi:hypothetical protein
VGFVRTLLDACGKKFERTEAPILFVVLSCFLIVTLKGHSGINLEGSGGSTYGLVLFYVSTLSRNKKEFDGRLHSFVYFYRQQPMIDSEVRPGNEA